MQENHTKLADGSAKPYDWVAEVLKMPEAQLTWHETRVAVQEIGEALYAKYTASGGQKPRSMWMSELDAEEATWAVWLIGKKSAVNLLIFSHTLAEHQIAHVAELIQDELRTELSEVIKVNVHLCMVDDFTPQINDLVDSLGVSEYRWKNETWLVVLPELSSAAAALLLDLHERMGRFPSIVRVLMAQNTYPARPAIAEIINPPEV